ncbi:ABC transporter ATP-binding protein [Desulfitobacterium chlororespirans]|uniref:ABC-2 type transport system ATP-binding protein n=1 Tax=Desulfitobacterium chlororespirans DSM 11544 TaxID=1121395 RepID=A0A1M7TW26_9FIRM|nr:ABC transporter ATP-binding protein [Desulfitobacterium chlororespirans]SHN74949.1 ABC-2 type transport system ATP-binding protein [Desulfitobacterium chlororespirans DSM 11544]
MLEVSELTKSYHEVRGVKNLSFQVESGTALGFLGPNGAGKTTTIRLLMGFMKPDLGSARIWGLDCWRDRAELKQITGYLPGELHFMEQFTGQEFLDLIEGMHGTQQTIRKRQKDLLRALDLDPKQRIRKMSKGMKQKLGIIAALMLDAPVLILDEPSSGLDPLMQKTFIELILEEKKREKTIFMSSHHFAEIERTCERVGMIRDGELLAIQDITLLKQKERQTFDIEVSGEEDAELLRQSGLTLYPLDHLKFTIQVTGEQELLWKTLAQIRVRRFQQGSLELEEAFMHYYHSSLRGDNT